MWYTRTVSHWGEQTLSANPPGANRNVAIARRVRVGKSVLCAVALRVCLCLARVCWSRITSGRQGHSVLLKQAAN
jgi:hypothetical protein